MENQQEEQKDVKKAELEPERLIAYYQTIATAARIPEGLDEEAFKDAPANIDTFKLVNSPSCSTFPLAAIEAYPSLTKLEMWGTTVREIPEQLTSLRHLKILTIMRNPIETLPASLGSMTTLQELQLDENRIAVLPGSLTSLTNLHRVLLATNRLSEFPTMLYSLPLVRILDLNENPLGRLPEDIHLMAALTDLRLSFTKLKVLPDSLCQLQLKQLDVRGNRLSSLPQGIQQMTSLVSLYLTWNDFTAIPVNLPTTLTVLHIGGNIINESDIVQYSSKSTMSVHYKCPLPNKITKGLWLGSLEGLKNRHFLNQQNITHILAILDDYQPLHPEDFENLVIPIDDVESADISLIFDQAIEFISTAINNKKTVLVHCAAGVSRSATIVIAYLMYSEKLTVQQAFKIVKDKRPQIHPNPGFINHLMNFEKLLATQNQQGEGKGSCILS